MTDDDKLAYTLNGLEALISRLSQSKENAARIMDILKSIRLNGDEYPTDYFTGRPITDSRRTEIYESCITDAEELLTEHGRKTYDQNNE